MKKISRRIALKATIISSFATIFKLEAKPLNRLHPTPSDTEGPFYPITAQKDKDFDLTKIKGKNETAKGDIIYIEGGVFDTDGNPIADAVVEIWQANAEGRYNHPRDKSQNQIDPYFQGWAVVPSGNQGQFKFKTIMPGAYGISRTRMRTPHIHYKISKQGYTELTTQMYFPNQALNETDGILNRHSKSEQSLMVAETVNGQKDHLSYKIILEKA